jgi:hypothetical protein
MATKEFLFAFADDESVEDEMLRLMRAVGVVQL